MSRSGFSAEEHIRGEGGTDLLDLDLSKDNLDSPRSVEVEFMRCEEGKCVVGFEGKG